MNKKQKTISLQLIETKQDFINYMELHRLDNYNDETLFMKNHLFNNSINIIISYDMFNGEYVYNLYVGIKNISSNDYDTFINNCIEYLELDNDNA